MLVTAAQFASLAAMRKAAPVFDVTEDLKGCRLVVTEPSGKRWLIDQAGTTYRVGSTNEETTA